MTRQVQILAFDGMEVLDYAGPYEVFNVAGELGDGAFAVASVGVTASPTGRGGSPSCRRSSWTTLRMRTSSSSRVDRGHARSCGTSGCWGGCGLARPGLSSCSRSVLAL